MEAHVNRFLCFSSRTAKLSGSLLVIYDKNNWHSDNKCVSTFAARPFGTNRFIHCTHVSSGNHLNGRLERLRCCIWTEYFGMSETVEKNRSESVRHSRSLNNIISWL